MATITRHFDSVSAMSALRPSRANARLAHEIEAWRAWDPKHFGGASSRDGFRLLLGGWAEGTARARSVLSALALPAVESTRRRPRWADQGDELDMARTYSGALDTAWRTTHRVNAPGGTQTARIAVCVGAPASVNARDYFWRGAVAAILSDTLEESGRSVA